MTVKRIVMAMVAGSAVFVVLAVTASMASCPMMKQMGGVKH